MEKHTKSRNALVVVLLLTAAMIFSFNGCNQLKRMEQVNRYEQMMKEYDSTTMKNKMVLMPKITELADSITQRK